MLALNKTIFIIIFEAKQTQRRAPTVVLKASDKLAIIKNSKILHEYPEKNVPEIKPTQKMDMEMQTEHDPTEDAYKKITNEIEQLNTQHYVTQKVKYLHFNMEV